MGMIDDFRSGIQDLITPEMKALQEKVSSLDKSTEARIAALTATMTAQNAALTSTMNAQNTALSTQLSANTAMLMAEIRTIASMVKASQESMQQALNLDKRLTAIEGKQVAPAASSESVFPRQSAEYYRRGAERAFAGRAQPDYASATAQPQPAEDVYENEAE